MKDTTTFEAVNCQTKMLSGSKHTLLTFWVCGVFCIAGSVPRPTVMARPGDANVWYSQPFLSPICPGRTAELKEKVIQFGFTAFQWSPVYPPMWYGAFPFWNRRPDLIPHYGATYYFETSSNLSAETVALGWAISHALNISFCSAFCSAEAVCERPSAQARRFPLPRHAEPPWLLWLFPLLSFCGDGPRRPSCPLSVSFCPPRLWPEDSHSCDTTLALDCFTLGGWKVRQRQTPQTTLTHAHTF